MVSNLRHIDTYSLSTFLAVVDLGSFTAAADHLSKTQAAVSLTISRLEELLGKRLIDRSSRRASLTPSGEKLLPYARRILQLEADAMADVTDGATDGRVKLGIPDDYIKTFGTALLEQFTTQYRNVYIDLQCHFSRSLEEQITNRELDVAVITQNPDNPKGEFLRYEEQVWCTSPNARPEDNACLPLALFSEASPIRPDIFSLLKEQGRSWKRAYSSSHVAGVVLAVASGNFLTVLPAPAVPDGWRRLGPAEGLPALPPLPLALLVTDTPRLPARQLAMFIRQEFSTRARLDEPPTE